MKKTYLVAVFALYLLVMLGCQRNDAPEQARAPHLLSVYLTDNPAVLDAVNLDIRSVEVKVDAGSGVVDEKSVAQQDSDRNNDSLGAAGSKLWNGGVPVGDQDQFGKWVGLPFNPGIYDVLKLRNGIEMLLGSASIEGTVRKIRIALGTQNNVVKNGVAAPLKIVDDSINHNLYIVVMEESRVKKDDGSIAVYIDFDLGRSVKEWDGQYYLQPYLRALPANKGLEIEGTVLPKEAQTLVKICTLSDTATAVPDDKGYFKVQGLSIGQYDVFYDAANPAYKDTVIKNIDFNINRVRLAIMNMQQK